MSVRNVSSVTNFVAGADLSALQYSFVKLHTTADQVVKCGAGERSIGILQNAPESGEVAEVHCDQGKFSYLKVVDATAALAALMKSDANGKGTVASADKEIYGAVIVQAGTSANDIVEVQIERGYISAT